ncbi:cytochrome P450 [Aspergillus undulatus]|uniref:cytochrome P450 n=1 Tax=Aspergillus undulatus TaxID=1810928 RepID=UPI003CCDE5A9
MEDPVNDTSQANYLLVFLAYYRMYGIYGLLAAAIAIYSVLIATYRLYFHPLARFPGPKLAAATGWYEFYYNVFRGGMYIYEIERMHRKYGPIVRINPYEIVVNDPSFYNTVYVTASTRRTDKWLDMEGRGMEGALITTQEHELHRRRRKSLEPFFSRLSISRIEPLIIEEARLLTDQLESLRKSCHVIRLDHVMSAFVGDVVIKLCSEKSPEMIRHPEFGKDWHNAFNVIARHVHITVQFPQVVPIVRMIPTAIQKRLLPGAAAFETLHQARNRAINHINDAKREMLSAEQVERNKNSSLFRRFLASQMPDSERKTERLARQAMELFGAGSITLTGFFTVTLYYILSSRHIRYRISKELESTMVDYPSRLPSWQDLERLPYLNATVKEGLRLSYGTLHHLPRVSPDSALQYKQWTIPPGTPVGMSTYSLHLDPSTYPDPRKFWPDRWLGDYNPDMNRNWVPFSRGSRNCLGMNLAYAEIYWALAVLFRPDAPHLELFKTDESDVLPVRDFLLPAPKLGSQGLRVTVS